MSSEGSIGVLTWVARQAQGWLWQEQQGWRGQLPVEVLSLLVLLLQCQLALLHTANVHRLYGSSGKSNRGKKGRTCGKGGQGKSRKVVSVWHGQRAAHPGP